MTLLKLTSWLSTLDVTGVNQKLTQWPGAQIQPLKLTVDCRGVDFCNPREALRGGIKRSFLEPLGRSWSHFMGIYRQK